MAFEELDGKQLDRLIRLYRHVEMWQQGCSYAVDSFYLPRDLMEQALKHLTECRDCQELLKQRETGDADEVLAAPADQQAERVFEQARQEAAVAQLAGPDHIFNRLRRSEDMVSSLKVALGTAEAFHSHLKAYVDRKAQ